MPTELWDAFRFLPPHSTNTLYYEKDSDTGDAITPVEDMLGTFEELKKTDNATQAQTIMYSKLFKINFTKMDPYEFKTFTDILQRYSDLCKPVKGNGRGRKKK